MKHYWKYIASLILAGTAIVALAQVPASFIRSGMLLSSGAASPLITASAYASGAITLPTNTDVALSFDTNAWDAGNIHSTSVNPTRFTAPQTGYYDFAAWVQIGAFSNNYLASFYKVNGSIPTGVDARGVASQNGNGAAIAVKLRLTAGDYVEAFAYSNPGGSVNTVAGACGGQLTYLGQ